MAFHLVEELRKKPRDEWHRYGRDKWANTRIWIQENGEAAFVLGLVLGLMLVVFNKLFILLVALAVILGGVLYMIAPETADPSSGASSEEVVSSDDSDTSSE